MINFILLIIAIIVIVIQWVYLPKVYFQTITHSRWMSIAHIVISILLLVVTAQLAYVNYNTYRRITDNYEIRNRPFVKIEPHSIVKKKKMINTATKELNTPFYPKFKLKNYGQFPAFIEKIDIWIEDEPNDLLIPKGSGDLNTENFALFQDEETKIDKWMFLLGDGDIEKIKKIKNENNQVYFIFKIIYNILGDEKNLQTKSFFYWAKYKCDNPIDNREAAEYSFDYILECGSNDKNPNN